MGQITSVERESHTHPLYVSKQLSLNKITIGSSQDDLSKLLKVITTKTIATEQHSPLRNSPMIPKPPSIRSSDQISLSSTAYYSSNDDTETDVSLDPTQNISKALVLPNTPISQFTQNKAINEWQFLLNVDSTDEVTFDLRSSDQVLKESTKFVSQVMKNFTIFTNLKALFYNSSKKFIGEQFISNKLELAYNGRSTMDPNHLQITTDDPCFNIVLDFNQLSEKISKSGRVYVSIVGDNEELIKFIIYVNKVKRDRLITDFTKSKNNLDNIHESNEEQIDDSVKDSQYDFISDGVNFREDVQRIEENLTNFKPLLRSIIKKAQSLDETSRNLALARSALCSSLSDLVNYSSVVENPLLQDLINDLIPLMTERSAKDIENSNLITKNLITPFILLYNSDLKFLSTKKKLYSDQSKEYYSWMSKFNNTYEHVLNKANDEQHILSKRLQFELNRFDYFTYLNEFRNGYLIRNLLYHLAVFLQKASENISVTPTANTTPDNGSTTSTRQSDIEADITKAFYYYKHFASYKSKQQITRNELSNIKTFEELSSFLTKQHTSKNTSPLSDSSDRLSIFSQAFNFETPQPVRKDGNSVIAKNGFLVTLGGGQKGWERHHVSLNNNILAEYLIDENDDISNNTSIQKDLKSKPLNLTKATINKIDTIKNRRFCFEIITTNKIKRIYECANEEDRENWLRTLNVSTILKISSSSSTTESIMKRSSLQPSNTLKPTSKSKKRVSIAGTTKKQAYNVSQSYHVSKSTSFENLKDIQNLNPLTVIHEVDISNKICADCGTLKQVDYILLDKLIVVCEDCARIHTKFLITIPQKVRSLTSESKLLKKPEVQELLYSVSNKFANSYWEAALHPFAKLTPLAAANDRIQFMKDKYIEKRYLQNDPSFKPNDSLIKGVRSQNIPLVLRALASGANSSMTVIKDKAGVKLELSIFEYSLSHFIGSLDEFPIFHISQLLLLNNSEIGTTVQSVLELKDPQRKFWNKKIQDVKEVKSSIAKNESKNIEQIVSSPSPVANDTFSGDTTKGNTGVSKDLETDSKLSDGISQVKKEKSLKTNKSLKFFSLRGPSAHA